MSDNQFTSIEEIASYGIGLQMGEQIASAFPGVSTEAALFGIQDAIAGRAPQVKPEVINHAFQVIQEQLKEQESANAEQFAAEGMAFLEENAQRDGITVTETGLQYEIISQGLGAKPEATSTVRTHYRGTLIDGTEFDSSYSRNEPTEFPVNGVIAGWTEALQLMNVGSKWKLYIPHELAYGPQGAGRCYWPLPGADF